MRGEPSRPPGIARRNPDKKAGDGMTDTSFEICLEISLPGFLSRKPELVRSDAGPWAGGLGLRAGAGPNRLRQHSQIRRTMGRQREQNKAEMWRTFTKHFLPK
jgi:hypothetical protein